MENIDSVCWDLDNTILPSKKIAEKVLHEILPHFGVTPPTSSMLGKHFGSPLPLLMKEISRHHPDQEKILAAFNETQLQYYLDIELFHGVLDVIKHFHSMGLKQAIITSRSNENKYHAGALSIIQRSGLQEFMAVTTTADDVVHHKPHHEPMLRTLQLLDAKAETTAMIGDHVVDMVMAKSVGALAIGIDHDKSAKNELLLKDAGADYTVQTVEALERLVIDLAF
ncbi:MAG: pyrophosphatase PpaX [Candidatus Saccharimonadales bacterium]